MSSRMQHLFVVVCLSILLNQTDVDNSRYTFNVEWHDSEASNIRYFFLFYYKQDGALELFDKKSQKMFLKKTTCDTVSVEDLFVGATITVFSRQMKIVSFADEFTRQQLGVVKQRTFAMIKPEAVMHMGEIFGIIIANGFKIAKLKMATMTKDQAREFYAEHEGKPFLPFLVEYITSGPIVGMELISGNGVKKWRELLGPTDSEQARKDAPGSIRARFGKDKSFNAAHGSDSPESAQRESGFFFPESRIAQTKSPRSTATFQNCTCCILKPHAVQDGHLGDIIKEIQQSGFKVTALQLFYMDHANAEEFYEVYKGVVAEYSGMVGQLISGASVVMEITGSDPETPVKFREFVGPADPDVARKLRPNTLRARFGKNKLQNAIHCTDLPEDGLLEVEYFFKILE